MLDKLDGVLSDLVDMTVEAVAEAKEMRHFDHDFIEAACIILSMAYSRFQGDEK